MFVIILARFEATGDPVASLLDYLLRFCDPANQDASIVIKYITFFGYVFNCDAILTWAGFIDPEGSIPITRCSTTYEQGSIIILIDRIDPESTNACPFNWMALVIHNNNIGGDGSPGGCAT